MDDFFSSPINAVSPKLKSMKAKFFIFTILFYIVAIASLALLVHPSSKAVNQNSCLHRVEQDHMIRWDLACSKLDQGSGCILPLKLGESLHTTREAGEKECLK
jgi:hypothetical protein